MAKKGLLTLKSKDKKAKDFERAVFGSKSEPHPASVTAQKTWQKFPAKLKKELRGNLPDSDLDKTPDGFDCRPLNSKKQESFLPQDQHYLDTHPNIRPTKKILGTGVVGSVTPVAGNPNLVVKMVRSYKGATDVVSNIRDGKFARRELKKEADDFEKYKLEKEPLFIPTKAVKIDGQLGLVRPKGIILTEYYPTFKVFHKEKITDEKLIKLRKDLIDLSYKGFVFADGLQLMLDDAGRILLYDIGFIQKDRPGSDHAFEVNNMHWQELLEKLGKKGKFGPITKRKEMGKRRA
jgi:hypothetical protein